MKLIDFNVSGRGFEIIYHPEGVKEEKEDKYWLYFKNWTLKKVEVKRNE